MPSLRPARPRRAPSAIFPRARWSEAETQELAKAFKAGGSIAQLARVHNRTQFAVEAQLERQGLWDRVERRPTAPDGGHRSRGEPHEVSQALGPTGTEAVAPAGTARATIPFGADRD
jgi:hypothetical protein